MYILTDSLIPITYLKSLLIFLHNGNSFKAKNPIDVVFKTNVHSFNEKQSAWDSPESSPGQDSLPWRLHIGPQGAAIGRVELIWGWMWHCVSGGMSQGTHHTAWWVPAPGTCQPPTSPPWLSPHSPATQQSNTFTYTVAVYSATQYHNDAVVLCDHLMHNDGAVFWVWWKLE